MTVLTVPQKKRLWDLRKEVMLSDHVLSAGRLRSIEKEVRRWAFLRGLEEGAKFFEQFDVYDAEGERTGVRAWRGLCHWLWLRHGCVHGMLFSPSEMVVLQRRASSVADSPGYLDMAFAGHMGHQEWEGAAESEAKEEMGLDLLPESGHLVNREDLQPICRYSYIEPPRPAEEFYNAETRYVFAIRVTSAAMGAIRPLDQEAGSFVLTPLKEAWALLRTEDVASALQVSGPFALYHAMRKWGWMI